MWFLQLSVHQNKTELLSSFECMVTHNFKFNLNNFLVIATNESTCTTSLSCG